MTSALCPSQLWLLICISIEELKSSSPECNGKQKWHPTLCNHCSLCQDTETISKTPTDTWQITINGANIRQYLTLQLPETDSVSCKSCLSSITINHSVVIFTTSLFKAFTYSYCKKITIAKDMTAKHLSYANFDNTDTVLLKILSRQIFCLNSNLTMFWQSTTTIYI